MLVIMGPVLRLWRTSVLCLLALAAVIYRAQQESKAARKAAMHQNHKVVPVASDRARVAASNCSTSAGRVISLPDKQLPIAGFDKVLQATGGPASTNFLGDLGTPRFPHEDLEQPPPHSARSDCEAVSVRSSASQQAIAELQAEVRRLRSEKKSGTPRSARSESSQRIIDDLQGQLKKAMEDKVATPRSARSETSQRIIEDLQGQIRSLAEEKSRLLLVQTPRSARSCHSTRSARSDVSQKIIDDLKGQIEKLQKKASEQKKDVAGGPGLSGKTDDLATLLRRIQLPTEYDKILADEGIEFLEDLEDYSEADLLELGLKRAHAKRLLKAVATQTAPGDVSELPRATSAPLPS